MPSVQDIQKFNKTLVSLGSEPAVQARRGEDVDEVPPPEEGLSSDISDLLGEEAEGGEPTEPAAEDEGAGGEEPAEAGEGEPEEPAAEDAAEAGGAEPGAPAPGEGAEEREPSAEDLGIEGLEEPESEPESEEDEFSQAFDEGLFDEAFGEEAEQGTQAESGAEAERGTEAGTEEFGAEEGEADEDFFSQFAEAMELGEEEESAEGDRGAEEPAESEAEAEAGPDETGAEEAPAEETGAPEAAEEEEGFGLPDDLDFAESFGEEEDTSFEEPDFGDFGGEEGAAEEEFGGAEELEEAESAAAEEPGEEEDPFAGMDLEDMSFEDEPEAETGEAETGEAETGEAETGEGIGEEEPFGEEESLEESAEEPAEEEEEEEEAFSLPEGFDFEPEEEEGFTESPEEEEEAPAAEAGGADTESFSEEDFSFEAEEEDAGGLSGEFGEEEDFEVDEFSLGDFGEEFGVLEEEEEGEGSEEELNPALDVTGEPPPQAAEEAAAPELELSDEDFAALRRRLGELPLNVKLAVEEAIGEGHGSAEQQQELVNLLVEGESARLIADRAGKILRRQIQVPKGYEKRSGATFEAQRGTLGYQFRENLLPILRVVVLAAVLVAALTYLGYRFVYQPLQARNLYEQGLAAIDAGEYELGNQRFDRAVEIWRVKDRYFQYANRFIEDRQYSRAQEKYEQLLTHYPGDKRGILEYAELESETLANYEKANDLLQRVLDDDIRDYEARLAKGDNFMRWGASLEGEAQNQRYEQAQDEYVRLLEYYGQTDPIMFRLMRYFIRVDNEEEVLRVKAALQSREELQINPQIYAELGGYLIDKNRMGDVREILMDTLEVNDRLPEAHYHLARYFHRNGEFSSELTALQNVVSVSRAQPQLNERELGMLVDTQRRLGDYYYRQEQYITAEEHYNRGIERFEDALQAGALDPAPEYGRLYAERADIDYYVAHEYDRALENLNRAEELGYVNRSVDYRQGFIHYRNEDYGQAVTNFMDAAGSYTENRPLLYATANALFHRESYSAAEGYYRQLLDIARRQRAQLGTLLVEEDEDHRAIIEYLIKTHNNLGAAQYRVYLRGTDGNDMLSESLVNFERSTELSTNFNRNPQTGERAERVDLAQLNMRHVLYPETDYTVQLYNDLPVDTEDLTF